MTHCGFEPSSVTDMFSSWSKFFSMVREYATIQGPRKARKAYPRDGRPYEKVLEETAPKS
jgi:hypothetical protein